MAHPILLQGWTTVRGGSGIAVKQQAADYADLIDYLDVVIYTEVADFSGLGSLS